MIAVVFKKELLSHLVSRQFAICTTLAVLLMSTNGLITSQSWSLKKASYQTKKAIEAQKPRDITYYSAFGRRHRPIGSEQAANIQEASRSPRLAGPRAP